jgi:hypothetical protein
MILSQLLSPNSHTTLLHYVDPTCETHMKTLLNKKLYFFKSYFNYNCCRSLIYSIQNVLCRILAMA